MEIFEQAIDDKRAIDRHGLDDGECVVVIARDRFDARDHGIGADGKKFERRLHESKPPVGRDLLLIVGRLAREQALGEGGYEAGGISGKIPVD